MLLVSCGFAIQIILSATRLASSESGIGHPGAPTKGGLSKEPDLPYLPAAILTWVLVWQVLGSWSSTI